MPGNLKEHNQHSPTPATVEKMYFLSFPHQLLPPVSSDIVLTSGVVSEPHLKAQTNQKELLTLRTVGLWCSLPREVEVEADHQGMYGSEHSFSVLGCAREDNRLLLGLLDVEL